MQAIKVLGNGAACGWRRVGNRCFTMGCLRLGQSRAMNKILKGPRKSSRKPNFHASPIISAHNAMAGIADEKKSTNTRRTNMLNKVFMVYITDLMASGAHADAFTGHGIEINRVKISADYKLIQVFWLSRSDSDSVENVEEMLKKHAGRLRHELSQLRVMGNVPKIDFVKDKHYTMMKLLDEKLAQADYGLDHEACDFAEKLKVELTLEAKLEARIREKIGCLDATEQLQEDEASLNDFDAPFMPQNVLGVQHDEIMKRIMKNVSRAQASHRKETERDEFSLEEDINANPVTYASNKVQREAFRAFLQQRQLLQLKAEKRDKTYRPDWDYLEEERSQQQERRLQRYDFHEYLNDDDYLDEKHD